MNYQGIRKNITKLRSINYWTSLVFGAGLGGLSTHLGHLARDNPTEPLTNLVIDNPMALTFVGAVALGFVSSLTNLFVRRNLIQDYVADRLLYMEQEYGGTRIYARQSVRNIAACCNLGDDVQRNPPAQAA